LPDELEDEDGNIWNPHMHLSLHAILECQIANDEPVGMRQADQKLTKAGIDRHDIRHLLALPLAEQLAEMMEHQIKFNEPVYMRAIADAVEKHSS
jgi:hypothetical protein